MVLHYENLPITIYGEYVDDNYYEEPHYKEIEERIVDFDYEVNDSKIIDILTGMIDYDEVPESISDDKIRDYIAKNLKSIYSNHKEEMLNYLEDEATEAAERYYNEQESWGDYDESLKEGKMKLTERKWNYTIESETATKFREAIDDGDLQGVKDSIIDIYEEIFNKGYIDEDDYNEYTEEVIDVDLDEDEIDFQLNELYDLCDNLGIFIPTHINEEVKIGDSEYLRGIAFLNENPKAYAYICSAEINGKKVPVGKGIMTSDEYQEYIENLNKNANLGRVNTIYQNDKEGHIKALYSTLDEELDDLPFPEAKPEKEISLEDISTMVENLKDKLSHIYTLAEERKDDLKLRKVFFNDLKKALSDDMFSYELSESKKEDFEVKNSKEKFNEKENDFSERDDDFDLDVDKLAEAVKNFEPQSPIINESVTQSNQIVEEAKKENANTNEISTKTDPNMDYDDVDDIELV